MGDQEGVGTQTLGRRASWRATRLRPKTVVKYKMYGQEDEEEELMKVRPSTLLDDVHRKSTVAQATASKTSSKPKIVELLNIADYSHHVECTVPVGEPIFQPFPTAVHFSGYEPFQTYESVLYLRNNDTVGRRVKVLPPHSPYFSVAKLAPKRAGAPADSGAGGATIAPGMEVAYVVTFKPVSAGDYACDLVVCTEREKFVVPIRAQGQQPALDVPDVIEFESVPCKSEVKRTFQVSNVGNSQALFTMQTSSGFLVVPSEGQLSPGESLQCTITFCPESSGVVEGELELCYESGRITATRLVGRGHEVDVEVSTQEVQLLPTYMNKVSQKTFKIYNRSDTVVRFSFRQYATEVMDAEATTNKISRLYETQQSATGDQRALPEAMLGRDSDFVPRNYGASSDEEDRILSSQLVSTARTLKRQRRAMLTEKPLFQAEFFRITPLEGTIWSGGEVEVTVQFTPKRHSEYMSTAFLDITGRASRLPMVLRGSGLGPKAMFSYDVLDVGDTFVHTVHQYEVELHNRGEVPAEFRLVRPDTFFGRMFEFHPSSGTVAPETVQVLQCRFLSDTLGEFAETFLCEVVGSSRPLTLDFRGQVVGPSFTLNCEEIDFGSVSFGFKYTKTVLLSNTCDIPMRYSLYVNRERDTSNPEFHIAPASGVLQAHKSVNIAVEFVSQRVANYANTLFVDVPGVGRQLQSIPIRAQSFVPGIKLNRDNIDYGDCFLQFPYKQTITLVNESQLPAKFEVLPQDDQSKNLGSIRCEPALGGVPAMGQTAVTVVLSTARRGRMQLPVRIRIFGSDADPLECVMSARSIGPALEFFQADQPKEKRSTRAHLDFGSCPVLRANTRVLNIFNPCPVPASFKAFVESPTSVFSISPREGLLQPGATLAVDVMCTMDDTRKFTDLLHVLVQDGDDVSVPLQAVGTGTCIVVEGVEDVLDFGKQLVGRPFEAQVVLRNMGRRPQTVLWHNTMKDVISKMIKQKQSKKKRTPDEEPSGSVLSGTNAGATAGANGAGATNAATATVGVAGSQAGGAAPKGAETEDVPEVVFSFTPDRCIINPRQTQMVLVSGLSTAQGVFTERVHLRASMGNVTKDIFKADFRAECTQPLLELSSNKLTFTYMWSEDSILAPMESALTLRNVTEIPLTLMLKTLPPFTLSKLEMLLEPGQDEELVVEFDPGFRTDKQSAVVAGKLQISYLDCPHRDQVDLVGEINFPNLKVQVDTLDFGCVLTDTLERRYFTITNVSSVPAAYEWSLAMQPEEDVKERKQGPVYLPPGEVFDILPVHGTLAPGASERIEATYYANPNACSSCWAVCNVTGGPSYEVRLSAESSHIRFSIDRHHVDIGRQQYNRAIDTEVCLQNTGRVPFNYVVNLSRLTRPNVVTASSLTGTVGPGHKDFIKLKITPGIPDRIMEEVVLEVAHCEPEVIRVVGEGTFQGVLLTLPRLDEGGFRALRDSARESLAKGGPRLHPADAAAMGRATGTMARGRGMSTAGPGTAGTLRGRPSLSLAEGAGGEIEGHLGAPYEPTPLEVDMEADRISLCQILTDRTAATELLPPAEASAKSLVSQGSQGPKRPLVVVAHYLLDLGHVTKGTTKTRKFRLQNTAPVPLSLSVDRRLLQAHGMSMEPEKILKLAEFSVANFSLTLDTALLPVGPTQCTVPVDVKTGPAVLVTIRGNVVIPELQLYRDQLDFGAVQAGHCKAVTVQLHNPREVPCDWHVKKPMEGDTDWHFFTCEPDSGTLPPGDYTNMRVVFTPARGRESPYHQKIPIRIAHNSKQVVLVCQGHGYSVNAALSVSSLHLGAILPARDGLDNQVPNRARVELFNPCDFPIEVFSLDMDSKYREEEECLQLLPTYNEHGQFLARPRLPGQEFWPEYRQMAEQVKQQRQADAEQQRTQAEAPGTAQPGASRQASPAVGAKRAVVSGAAGEGDAGLGEADRGRTPVSAAGVGELEAAPEDPKSRALYLVVTGPPGSGRSTLARKLAERYGVPRVTVASLVEEASELTVSIPEEGAPGVAPEERAAAVALAEACERVVAVMNARVAGSGAFEGVAPEVAARVLPAVLRGDKYKEGFVVDGLDAEGVFGGAHAQSLETLAAGVGLVRTEVLDEKGKATGRYVWEGAAMLRVVCLELGPSEILARTGGSLEGGAQVRPARTSSKLKGGSTQKALKVEKGGKGGKADKAAEKADAGAEAGLTDELLALYREWEQEGTPDALRAAAGMGPGGKGPSATVEVVTVSAAAGEDEVLRSAVGIEFDLGKLTTRLPRVDRDRLLIPPDFTLEIVKKPRSRPKRQSPTHFEVFTVRERSAEEVARLAAEAAKAKAPAGRPTKTPDPAADPKIALSRESRWVLQPGERVQLEVHFKSADIGTFMERFGLEARGGNQLDLSCAGTCAYPQISTDFRNMFYRKIRGRPSTPTISKQFVISEEVFDFGPLLAGRNKEGYLDGKHPEHTAQFRITNNGLFDLKASFWLKSTVKKEGELGLAETNEFIVRPATMGLKVDETQDLQVFAFPGKVEKIADALVCSVALNPEPVVVPLRAVGTKPDVEIRGMGKDGKEGIKFQRLLLGKRDTRTFELHNHSLLPVKWWLDKVADLPPELSVSPTEGVLPAREAATVRVELAAKTPRQVAGSVSLRVQDERGVMPVAQDATIVIAGEAYAISTDVQYPAADKPGIDFGTVRVDDTETRSLVLANTGKYEVAFSVAMRGNVLKDLIAVEPQKGKINPNGKAEIKVTLNPTKTLKTEVTLVENNHLSLHIIEPLNDNTETTIPVPVSLRAVFSKYTITPARGLNFGPNVYSTDSAPRTINIRNNGDFPFTLALLKAGAAPPEKPADAAKAPPPPPNLTVGQFVFEPAQAVVQPGQTQAIKVVFKADGRRQFAEQIAVHISERDPADHPKGIPYEVSGESCIPGINAEDVAAIFEEHRVVNSLDPFHPMPGAYAMQERVFDFGAVIATLGEGEASEQKASFKISNPIKVPCVVNLKIASRGPEANDKNPPPFPMSVDPPRLNIPPHEYRYVTVRFAPTAIQQYSGEFRAEVENGGDPKTASLVFEVRGEGVLPHLSLVQPAERDAAGRPVLRFPRMLKGRSATLPIVVRNDGSIPTTARLEATPHAAFRLETGAGLFTAAPGETRRFVVAFDPREPGTSMHELALSVRHNPFEQLRLMLQGECFEEDLVFTALPRDLADELHFPDGPLGTRQEVLFNVRNLGSRALRFAFRNLPDCLRLVPSRGVLLPGTSKPIQATLFARAPAKLTGHEVSVAYEPVAFEGEPFDWDDREAAAAAQVAAEAGEATPGRAGSPTNAPTPAPGKGRSPTPTQGVGKGASHASDKSGAGSALDRAGDPPGVKAAGDSRSTALRVFGVLDNPRFEAGREDIDFRPTMMFQTRSFSFPLRNVSDARMDFTFKLETPSGEADPSGPFRVSPERGSIDAGEEALITVRFSPREVEFYERVLVCMVPHLPESAEPLVRRLRGTVLRPWCHFELPESDYVSGGRRNPEMPDARGNLGPLDPATKVLEMESLGLRVRNTRRFYVLNPTNVTYEFSWEPVGTSASADGPFVCQTRRGVITGGKRYEMIFSYVPEANELQESHWAFRIAQQGIEVPFLIVGHVKEPQVLLDRSAVNFQLVQVGGKVRETVHLVNEEGIPFEFSFDKASYEATKARIAATGQRPTCDFSPASGSVPPKSSLPITVSFEPTREGLFNYNVVCNVRRKPTRLTLNVKGEGFLLRDSLSIDTADGRPQALTDAGDNQVDFGQVIINERAVKQLSLVNSGSVPYEFVFDAGDNPNVSLSPLSGRVGPGDRVLVDLAYSPRRPETLSEYLVTCQIVNGRRYRMRLFATGHKPRLDLSFYNYDFGQQLIVEGGVRPAKAVLRASNNDTREITMDCLFENTPHLQVECAPTVLQPGQVQDIEITFSPRAEGPVRETVPFELNGLTSVSVLVMGAGTPMRLALADGSHTVNLGSARVGQQVSRTVKVKNAAPVAVDVDLTAAAQQLAKLGIGLLPAGTVLVGPRESLDLTFLFRPPARLRPFSQEVAVTAAGRPMTLFQLQGACLGTEVKLASDSLPFGAVVLGSSVTKRLQLENTGDVGTKFTWDVPALGRHFSIAPTTGFIAAGQDIKLDVKFEPRETNPDVRVERVRLAVEGCEDQFLTLTGACVAQEAQPDKLSFSTPVRETQEKAITVKNPSASDWVLRPVVNNEAWSGAEFLTVPAGKQTPYAVRYQPMRMADAANPHLGSVFFPLPNGQGLLYQLTGVATAPKAAGKITVEVPAKTMHQEVVKVANWDKHMQRFAVSVDLPNRPKACVCETADYIDVPGLATRDLRLTLSNPLEGSLTGKVTFTNQQTREYLYYDLVFKTTAPAPQGSVVLECPVRQKARGSVHVANPLDDPVTLDVKCSDPAVEVPTSVVVPGKATGEVVASYRPLLEAESHATLTVSNAALGRFEFQLHLRGLPTGPESSVDFSVPLGSHEVRRITLRHFLPGPCDYAVSFANDGKAGFSAPAGVVKVPAATGKDGSEFTVEVQFEPKAIGENFRDTVVVSSDRGGTYKCPLLGRCIPPKPRGPIEVRPGGGAVPFRNVFDREMEYHLVVDNPAFVVKATEVIKAKTTVNFSVQYKPVADAGTTGMLTVMCAESSSPWCFYLRAP